MNIRPELELLVISLELSTGLGGQKEVWRVWGVSVIRESIELS